MNIFVNKISLAVGLLLIMMHNPAQSMEMSTIYELPESGIAIDFSESTFDAHPADTRNIEPSKDTSETSTQTDPIVYELPETGEVISFAEEGESTNDDSSGSIRHIAKPPVETPAPWAGERYRRVFTFELPESGQVIVFPKIIHQPGRNDVDKMAAVKKD